MTKASTKPKRSAASFALPLDFAPMEARSEESLPEGTGWSYEPKWDGFRCLVFKEGETVDLRAKSGKPLGRYFPELVAHVAALAPERFVLDGEIVIDIDGAFSFDALQMRLHPAESRVRKLSVETPAQIILFDMLVAPDGERLVEEPLSDRRRALEKLVKSLRSKQLTLSPTTRTRDKAAAWLAEAGGKTDGVVAKQWDAPYAPGERAMIKVKRLRTADCVVGGFRYASGSREVGSLLLGLYNDDGKLDHVGFTSTIAKAERAALTKKLEKLRKPPGFTGDAPGGPSRWSTERSTQWEPLKPELVVEVRYDHVSGGRFRHGTKLMRWRPDKAPRQCTHQQIAQAGAA